MNEQKIWWRFSVEISQNIEDLVIWKLNELEISTYAFTYSEQEENQRKLLIWLPDFYWNKFERKKLEDKFKRFLNENNFFTAKFSWNMIYSDEWLNSWKNFWNLEIIGKNFLVLPCWMELPSKFNNKVIIKLDPGAAFGTGSHPSTSLSLEMMEKTLLKDKKILDVGCGSGILSIAAKKLGAKELFVIDNDYLAINSTKENILLNFGKFNSFNLLKGSFFEVKTAKILKTYDLILCNILASVIKQLIPHFYEIINRHGYLILSGILSSQKEEIIKLLNLYHFKIDNVLSKKDWICIKSFKVTKK